jgi:transmembrane sensor
VNTPEEIELLFKRFLSDNCSPAEVNLVIDLVKAGKADEVLPPLYEEVWQKINFVPVSDEHSSQLFSTVKARISTGKKKSFLSGIGVWKIAASVILVLGLGLTITNQIKKTEAPSADIAQVIKTTHDGQKTTVQLSDGTVVKLNAGSRLTFDSLFSGNKRSVSLEGEAFFEVAKDPNRPFVISSDNVTTTVLGTSFNINAFREEVVVTVASGSVRVEAPEGQVRQLILKRGQQASYSSSNKLLSLREVDIDYYLAWKNGVLDFREANEKEVFSRLSKWYGVSFETNEADGSQHWGINAKYDNKSLEFVLNSLSYSVGFNYQLEGKKVLIKYNK